jgi:SAM-dependent methyltransferase
MRDPEGRLQFQKDTVLRFINSDSLSLPLLKETLVQELINEKLLIPFQFIDDVTLESPKLPFVSQPHEWCFEQLRDAGRLTVALSKRIRTQKWELKDASAWNILFDGCTPLFCDYLSFKKTDSPYWWAMGQFVRHFTLPLATHRKKSLKTHQIFRLSRDGLSLDLAKNLLLYKIFFSRALPFAFVGNPKQSAKKSSSSSAPNFENIYEFLSWSINYKDTRTTSTWSDYTDNRSHYSDAQVLLKKETVKRWLNQIKPQWLADIGCNTGEFSEIAIESGAKVISADYDDECISRLYLRAKSEPSLVNKLHPIIFNLGDALGSTGAGGIEFSSAIERIGNVADCVLMLGLLHHLLISESIPMPMLIQIISKMTQDYAILELVDPNDVQHQLLCEQRNRNGSILSINEQRNQLASAFDLIDEIETIPNHRLLCLMKKKVH